MACSQFNSWNCNMWNGNAHERLGDICYSCCSWCDWKRGNRIVDASWDIGNELKAFLPCQINLNWKRNVVSDWRRVTQALIHIQFHNIEFVTTKLQRNYGRKFFINSTRSGYLWLEGRSRCLNYFSHFSQIKSEAFKRNESTKGTTKRAILILCLFVVPLDQWDLECRRLFRLHFSAFRFLLLPQICARSTGYSTERETMS